MPADNNTIRSFQVDFRDEEVAELRRRVTATASTGWDPTRIARAWTELMRRLGYTRFVAQGGDWGAAVTQAMGI